MSEHRIRLVIVVSHPIQYFAPVYRELAKDPAIQLTVLFTTRVGVDDYYDPGFGRQVKWDIPLTEGYDFVFLSARVKKGGIQWRIVSELLKQHPDVVLFHGYNQPTNLLGILVAKILGKKILMRGDTRTSLHNKKRNLKYKFKQYLFSQLDGFVTIGTLNREYHLSFGVPERKLFFAPFCVDNQAFDLGERAESERARVRTELEIPENKYVVLFVAKLSKRKRPHDLLVSFASVQRNHPDTVLVYAGSGEQEDSLRKEAMSRDIDVRFLGFVNQSQLPALYAASDVFVLPSMDEPWGLVVNEAMSAGLPVVTTEDVGAAYDLVMGKATGQVYATGDVDALAEILEDWFSSPKKIKDMARRAKLLICDWDIGSCAKGIVAAAVKVKEGKMA